MWGTVHAMTPTTTTAILQDRSWVTRDTGLAMTGGKGRSYLISFPAQSLLILFAVWWCYLNNQGGS